jgi:hypothetical protein
MLGLVAIACASVSCHRGSSAGSGTSPPPPIASSPSPEEAAAAGWPAGARPIVWHASPRNLALNDTHVFFTDDRGDGTVFRVPKDGGAADAVATKQARLGRIAANGAKVFWIADAGSVFEAAVEGGAPAVLLPSAEGKGAAVDLATDAGHVYVLWAEATPTPGATTRSAGAREMPRTAKILRVDNGGHEPTLLGSVPGSRARRIAVDSTGIYWTDAENGVMRLALAGGSPTALVAGAGTVTSPAPHPFALALSAERVTFGDAFDHRLRSVAKEGGAVEVLDASGDLSEEGLVVARGNVYCGEMSGMQGLRKIPLAGGKPQSICCGGGGGAVATDGAAVFVTSPTTNTVLRVAL